jgi:hypothetical protein
MVVGEGRKIKPVDELHMVHVAVVPPATVELCLVIEVASILGRDLYSARLLLTGRTPKIVAHYPTLSLAESAAERLRALGLIIIVGSDAELGKPAESFLARTLKPEADAVTFYNKNGQARILTAGEVFLVLHGIIRSDAVKEITKTAMKFNLPATLLTGGIPIWHRVEKKAPQGSLPTESFVRLYGRDSPEPKVELLQSDFDYSFLGPEITPTSIKNMQVVVKAFAHIFPDSFFDNRLTEPFRVDIPFATLQDDLEVNCRLLYLYYQAMSRQKPSA